MDPLTVAAGASIASAAFQAYNDAKAQNASAAELAKLRLMVEQTKDPNFDVSKITPEQFQVVGQYDPKVASYLAEKNPTLVTGQGADAQAGQAARMQALQKYQDLGRTGVDAQSQALNDAAGTSAATTNAGMQGQLADSFAARGQSGAGSELAQRLSAMQGTNQRLGAASAANAQNAYQTRLQALANSARIGGDIRSDAVNMEGQNANVINAFNQRTAANMNAYNQYATGTANQAQATNLAAAQSAADRNVSQNNQATQANQQLKNQAAQQNFNNDMSKVKLDAGITDNARSDIYQGAEAQNNIASGIADTAGIFADRAQKQQQIDADKAKAKAAGGY